MIYDADGNEYAGKKRLPLDIIVTRSLVLLVAGAVVVLAVAAFLMEHHKDTQFVGLDADVPPQVGTPTFTMPTTIPPPSPAMPSAWTDRPHLKPPKDAPPSTILIGHSIYTVYYTSADALLSAGSLALSNSDTKEIWLDPERTSELRKDLLHELMHCAANELPEDTWENSQNWGGGQGVRDQAHRS